MTIARVPLGASDGGRFTTSPRQEAHLTLVPSATSPQFPDRVALVEQWPNRRQRLDVVNVSLYAIAAHDRSHGADRVRACREAVRDTLEVHGHFSSLPEDDGVGASYVLSALDSDAKIEQALDAVGDLASHEQSTFGARLAGALYDIETCERLCALDPVEPAGQREDLVTW